ncbi:LysM peptidoglycan-binding domain-containing protein [Facilibium subflavum]|uniref:LysM peptidoglycan-binding domain-containing protein n=1 Tax=Facilibium subflavum TaxID=2219058 RepID=UPI000E654806|nr:LysM peptidoglycan-binding domain-containing protein [Facilibium subflavum]
MKKKLLWIVPMVGLLSSCASINRFFNAKQAPAPVKSIQTNTTYYVVQEGDTLYHVSQQFNVTERTLILWNHLPSPYLLSPGDKIRVAPLPGEKVWRAGDKVTVEPQEVKQPDNMSLTTENTADTKTGEQDNSIPVIDENAAPISHVTANKSVETKNQKPVEALSHAQYDDLQGGSSTLSKQVYIVQRGDSLGSIAQRFNVSMADLQQWNDIKEPSLIYVGEKIYLYPSANQKKTTHTASTQRVKSTTKQHTEEIKAQNKVQASEITQKTETTKANLDSKVTNTHKTPVQSDTHKISPTKSAQPTSVQTVTASIPSGMTVDKISWAWPLADKGQFDKPDKAEQLAINTTQGQAVLAAAKGKILYAGVGMGGYGKMVIIDHGNGYISAYNDLNQLDVKEGQDVNQHQSIGQVGKFNGQSALGFEIRQNGQLKNLGDFYRF